MSHSLRVDSDECGKNFGTVRVISQFNISLNMCNTNARLRMRETFRFDGIYILPNTSIAYTGLCDARASRFKHHNATPAPRPCNKTIGVFGESSFNDMVHILSAGPTTGPISTYHPLYAVFRPATFRSIGNSSFDQSTFAHTRVNTHACVHACMNSLT